MTGNELALLADARNALERARTLQEVKDILDIAVAAKKYAEAKKLGEDAVRYASEIVLRATSRLGEFTRQINSAGYVQDAGTDSDTETTPTIKTRVAMLRDLDISTTTAFRAEQIAALPEVAFESFLTTEKELSVNKLMRYTREWKANQRRTEYIAPDYGIGDFDIRHGDFRQCLNGLDGQVDSIITDPPYPREYIPIYEDLAHLALRVLKPKTGVLAVMAGEMFLQEIMERLGRHMRYRWICAYLTTGAHGRVWEARIGQGWKPILLYRHPDSLTTDQTFIPLDVFHSTGVTSTKSAKNDHDWQQTTSGMNDLVERLSPPSGLVLDPFLGSGTTGVACVDQKRRFVGCDIDASCVQISRERISSRLREGNN